MVIVNLNGGLGNQLYQYAVARFIAHKLNTELKISAKIIHRRQSHGHGQYRLGDFNIRENFATPEEIARVKENGALNPTYSELENFQRDIFILGNWMHSEEFFLPIADILRREFTLKNPLHKNSAAWEKKILSAKCSVALHVRRSDYLNAINIHVAGAIPPAYYRSCVDRMKKIFPSVTAFIFSDDLNWARKNLHLDVPTEFVDDCETDNEEFFLMSLCKHTVIANSTFSWWAARLNQNPDKKIFAPDPWTRSGLWNNGISAGWIKVPVDFEDVPADSPPLLSIIVYVKNNAANLPWLIAGIEGQTFKDYELILIDDGSTDGSEHICRQASRNKKVTFIRSGISCVGKTAAYNRALDFARGEFVIFLSGNDLILPDAVKNLCEMYSRRTPNIFCSVQHMQETPQGNVTFKDLRGKTFRHVVDDEFKDLREAIFFRTDDLYHKLKMLGTRSFNPLLGTKFFHRDFLTKNSLRFNENVQNDAEFLFVVNAFMACEEIIFTPELFYVARQK